MLTVEEALLFQAVKDEQARQEAMQQGTAAGAIGGAALGAGIGAVPHTVGKAINQRAQSIRLIGLLALVLLEV